MNGDQKITCEHRGGRNDDLVSRRRLIPAAANFLFARRIGYIEVAKGFEGTDVEA
jgi:hypothetical protein